MTYGFCAYHEIECDYDGQCVECPHNTKEDTEWFRQDEKIENEARPNEAKRDFPWNKDKRKRKGLCRQCGNTSDFVCSKCHLNPTRSKGDKTE